MKKNNNQSKDDKNYIPKSVMHIPKSASSYKVKKTGRLGKNCIYFSGGMCSRYN